MWSGFTLRLTSFILQRQPELGLTWKHKEPTIVGRFKPEVSKTVAYRFQPQDDSEFNYSGNYRATTEFILGLRETYAFPHQSGVLDYEQARRLLDEVINEIACDDEEALSGF
jgi:hypothetical protein